MHWSASVHWLIILEHWLLGKCWIRYWSRALLPQKLIWSTPRAFVSAKRPTGGSPHPTHFVPCDAFFFQYNLKCAGVEEPELSSENPWVLGQNSHGCVVEAGPEPVNASTSFPRIHPHRWVRTGLSPGLQLDMGNGTCSLLSIPFPGTHQSPRIPFSFLRIYPILSILRTTVSSVRTLIISHLKYYNSLSLTGLPSSTTPLSLPPLLFLLHKSWATFQDENRIMPLPPEASLAPS